ncbi:MAG: type II toxin-antitoxin system RelE/ParE family toxin [Deltaproteobacteria bacterium]|nr:type II toxin-antitoxin system RelE/ParE family toxin [Deltaproteobacteria bacterium]
MNAIVFATPEGFESTNEADSWWREHNTPPDAFRKDFDEAMELLARFPDLGPPFARRGIPGLRRLLLRRVQVHVYYVHDVSAATVAVICVWSTRRRRPRLKAPQW